MIRNLLVIKVFAFVILVLTACNVNDDTLLVAGETGIENSLGIEMVIEEVASYGISLSLQNMTDNEYIYGSHYVLYVFTNGVWEPVIPIIEDWAFTDIGYTLYPQSITDTIVVDWVWLYGELPSGDYRIRKPIWPVDGSSGFEGFAVMGYFSLGD